MKRTLGLLLAASSLIGVNSAFAQNLHTLTYTEKARAVDSTIYLLTAPHRIVRTPVTEFGTGTRYAVFYAWSSAVQAPVTGLSPSGPGIAATHDTNPINSNITIDSFPAELTLNEQIQYQMNDNGIGGFALTVRTNLSVVLRIDIGDTILQLGTSLVFAGAGVDTGTTSNDIPYAEWNRFDDNAAMLNALDRWIDFIRIEPL